MDGNVSIVCGIMVVGVDMEVSLMDMEVSLMDM